MHVLYVMQLTMFALDARLLVRWIRLRTSMAISSFPSESKNFGLSGRKPRIRNASKLMQPMHIILKRQGVYTINPIENDHFIGIMAHAINDISKTASVIHIEANVIALGLVWLLWNSPKYGRAEDCMPAILC